MRPVTDPDWLDLAAGISLVATDLDGTLLRPDTTVSAFTVDDPGAGARRRAARGRRDRPPAALDRARSPRRPVTPVSASAPTAAVLVDLATGLITESFPLGPDALDEVVATLRAEVPGIGFAIEWAAPDSAHAETFAYERAFRTRFPIEVPAYDGDIREVARGHRVVKLLARVEGDHHDADAFVDLALGARRAPGHRDPLERRTTCCSR